MFKKNRQGVELTLNVVIIAIISLIVLALLAFLLIKGFGNWNSGTQCAANNGACLDKCDDRYPVNSAYSCDGADKGKKCCINIGGLGDEKPTS
ncbi:MAG: hypothetical protein ACP5N1_01675 [Candidatus Woesearchaeota archaeon]